MKRLSKKVDLDLTVVTSEAGYYLCSVRGLKATFEITTQEYKTGNVALLYARRMLSALLVNFDIKKGAILYSTSDFLPDVLPPYVLKLRNKNVKWVQVIHHLYENPFIRKGENFVTNLFGFLSQRLSFILAKKRADLIIIVNPIIRQQLIKIGFNGKKMFMNYNGVDIEKIHTFQPSVFKYDCIFLGRLNVSKGIFDLLEIWKGVIAKKPYATLAIIGGGNNKLEQKLKNEIIKSNLEKNVTVFGYLNDAEAFGILKSSKIFVFPSHEEGFGIAILEAMACGLPVIAWNLPVYKEVFPRGIITVPIKNFDEFVETTLKLLEDSELRSSVGKDALDIASKYSWDKVARQELLLLESLQK